MSIVYKYITHTLYPNLITKYIIQYYIINTRLIFAYRRKNEYSKKIENIKKLKKMSKLV